MRDWAENHVTMVLLGVDREVDLTDWEFYLKHGSQDLHACFREPDLANEMTAIAVLPKEPTDFKSLRLL